MSVPRFCVLGLCIAVLLAGLRILTVRASAGKPDAAAPESCPSNDNGLTLPAGFCATVFADDIGHARQMVVAPDGVLYVNTWSGAYYNNAPAHAGGFLVALRDKSRSGKAEAVERFGETVQSGGAGGTGIGIYKDWLYAEINDRIVRYQMPATAMVPSGSAETIVSGLPLGGDHPMHPFIISADGSMYVDVASASNSCQLQNRQPKSPGANPCTELETRGGVWRYNANELNQRFSPAQRFATGIRNGEGFASDSAGRVFVTQHGRDQLYSNWREDYKPEDEATLPAEEVLLLKSGGDYGWPECYYDPFVQKLMLSPEYGGDGKTVGICASKLEPAAVFPAHWAPNAMTSYDKKAFPSRYREGVFIAFHGSWNRAPYPQGGYNVVFQPMANGHASGNCEIFADGFAGSVKTPDGAEHRPSGLAVGPDGALYVSDDVRGRIYRISYQAGANSSGTTTPCPSAASPAGEIARLHAKPPEGTHPEAGVSVPEGATREMVALGDRIYHGQVAGAACAGCHGEKGTGSPLGPDLTSKKWLWSDGSYSGITKTITDGVPNPKQYRSPMPPMGGAKLTPEQLSAVAAYVWSLSH